MSDEEDRELGTCEKLKAHQDGLLHRAFSIFIFNAQNEMLIHKRAWGKYHSAGLWTNACCSHPRPGEAIESAALRRLDEEMGFECALQKVFSLLYRAQVSKDLIEHELDYVFVGNFAGPIDCVNPEEVDSWRWVAIPDLLEEVSQFPHQFTAWFHLALPKVLLRF